MPTVDLDAFAGHTPGPWTLIETAGDSQRMICGPNGERIAILDMPDDGDPKNSLNARLMNASPDLLAEVRGLRAEVERLRKPSETKQ